MITRRTDADDPGSIQAQTEYELARLPREMTTAVTWYMKERGITKRELAQRLDVTPGRVSQILSGDENLTLRTLASVCAALDAHFEVELAANKPADAELVTFAGAAGPAREG
jgi:transcriptional regulator with XRE-family HTH domain